MTTKITVFTYSPNDDGYFHQVRVNNEATHTDFENLKDAREAAFIEACKESMNGPVRVEEVKA